MVPPLFDTSAVATKAQERTSDQPQPCKVSIVICTKDRPNELARAISSIRASGNVGRQAELVVVEEADEARELEGVRYVHLPRAGQGFGYARNMGVQAAAGDVILFIDDDCEARNGWADALAKPLLHDPQILGVAGAVQVKDCGLIGYAENILGFPGGGLRYFHGADGRTVPTLYLSTCNCAYRRSALTQAGGFETRARLGGEDLLLAERITAMGPCVYAPDAIVFHKPRGTFSSVFKWFRRRGQSEIGLLHLTEQRGAHVRFLLRSSWTLRALLVLGPLALWPMLALLLPILGLAYYSAVLWRFRYARHYPEHKRAWWLVPFVKLVMDWGAEAGRWKGLLFPRLA